MDLSLKKEFIRKRLNRSIVLVGLMGAGKTSMGRALAKSLKMEFVDSDDLIAAQENCSIADIFDNKGEAHFRDLERNTIIDICRADNVKIIGTGGGAFMNDETRAAIQKNALSLFIRADLDVLVKRVGDGRGRPLFKGKSTMAVLDELMKERYPIYDQAHITVMTHDEPHEETLNRVLQTLYSLLLAG